MRFYDYNIFTTKSLQQFEIMMNKYPQGESIDGVINSANLQESKLLRHNIYNILLSLYVIFISIQNLAFDLGIYGLIQPLIILVLNIINGVLIYKKRKKLLQFEKDYPLVIMDSKKNLYLAPLISYSFLLFANIISMLPTLLQIF